MDVTEKANEKAKPEDKIKKLVREFEGMLDPQHKKLAMLAKQAHDGQEQLRKNVGSLQESLEGLRIFIKYLLFDLEATRRENKHLRKMLDDKNS